MRDFEKVCLGDMKNLPILTSFKAIVVLLLHLKRNYSKNEIERLARIFVQCYSYDITSYFNLTENVAGRIEQYGQMIDKEKLRLDLVSYNLFEEIYTNQKEMQVIDIIRRMLKDVYIDLNVYMYLEENIKKVIVYNTFKNILTFNFSTPVVVRVAKPRLKLLVEDGKKELFERQFKVWAIYNLIEPCVKVIKKKDDDFYFSFTLLE